MFYKDEDTIHGFRVEHSQARFQTYMPENPNEHENRYPYTDSDSPVPSSFHCPPCVHRIYSPGSHAEFSNRGQGRFVLDDNSVLFVIFLLSCVNSNTGNQTTHFKSCVDDIKVCGVVAKCERTVNLLLIGSNEMI